MKVELIDYTGSESKDKLYAAKILVITKSTRLEQNAQTRSTIWTMNNEAIDKELNYISNTIRSSWEMVDFLFSIQGVTRAFTHQLVRTRTASYAQQAMRVVDSGKFDTLVPESVTSADGGFYWKELMRNISYVYKRYQDMKVPNQDCRGVLPTNVLTNIMMKVNLRTLADLVGKRENLRAQGEYTDVVVEMEKLVFEVMPWTRAFLKPERTATPALDTILKEVLGDKSPIDYPLMNDALKELDKLKGTWG